MKSKTKAIILSRFVGVLKWKELASCRSAYLRLPDQIVARLLARLAGAVGFRKRPSSLICFSSPALNTGCSVTCVEILHLHFKLEPLSRPLMLLEYLQFRPEIAQIFENAHTLTDTPKLITSSIPEVINLHLTPKSITCIPEIDNRYI